MNGVVTLPRPDTIAAARAVDVSTVFGEGDGEAFNPVPTLSAKESLRRPAGLAPAPPVTTDV